MPPTPQQIAQWQAWLVEAQGAYQALMTGRMAIDVAVDGNAYLTRFARPDADKLEAWIVKLQGWLDAAAGLYSTGGAIGVAF